jgi:hypothetical protein
LKKNGIEVIEMDGLIEQGLEHVFNGEPLPGKRMMKGCSSKSCGGGSGGCGGNGMGCL